MLKNEILEPVPAEVRCKIPLSSTEVMLPVTARTKSETHWPPTQPGWASVLRDAAPPCKSSQPLARLKALPRPLLDTSQSRFTVSLCPDRALCPRLLAEIKTILFQTTHFLLFHAEENLC